MKKYLIWVLLVVLAAGASFSAAADEKFTARVTSEQKPPPLPAALKARVKEGMTLGELVNALGPGWNSIFVSNSNANWSFDDGTLLVVVQAMGGKPEQVLSFEKKKGSTAMFWMPPK